MNALKGLTILLAVCFGFVATGLLADDKPNEKPGDAGGTPPISPAAASSRAASPAEIDRALATLGGSDFKSRSQAMRDLIEAGASAIAPVAAKADTDNLELSTRCIDILKKQMQSDDETVHAQAEAALKKLAKSKRRSVAQRAADALKQADENNGAVLIGNAAANGVQVQVQVVAGPGGNVVQVIQQNQNRDIVVEENGKKVHIEEATGKGIKVSITETVDGKEQTKVWQAKDLAELKQKHPEAAKLYQKHAPLANVLGGAIGVGRVQIQGLPAGVQNIQIQAGAQRAGIDRGALAEQIKQANDRLEKTVEGLEKLAADANASPESLRKLAAEIGRIRAELSAVNKKLAE